MTVANSRGPLRQRLLTGGVLALLTAGAALSSKASASYRVEEPSYEVESTHDSFEVRRYAPRIVAQATMIGYIDAFVFFSAAAALAAPLVFLVRVKRPAKAA